jgi:hypothetical protein
MSEDNISDVLCDQFLSIRLNFVEAGSMDPGVGMPSWQHPVPKGRIRI